MEKVWGRASSPKSFQCRTCNFPKVLSVPYVRLSQSPSSAAHLSTSMSEGSQDCAQSNFVESVLALLQMANERMLSNGSAPTYLLLQTDLEQIR
jgi:hypothetical protein